MSQSVTTSNDKQNNDKQNNDKQNNDKQNNDKQNNIIDNDKKNSKLYKSRKIVGKGLKKIGTTLGAIGTPIFAVVPPLRPFGFLLGENSLYYQLGKVIEPKEGGYNYPNNLFHHVY